jgi:hypothetical protein
MPLDALKGHDLPYWPHNMRTARFSFSARRSLVGIGLPVRQDACQLMLWVTVRGPG